MSEIIMPMQFFGLGDIIWEQTIIRNLMKKNDRVLWPVEPQFVEGLNRAYPDFMFIDYNSIKIDWTKNIEHYAFGMKVLPIRWADTICRVPYNSCMKSKYMLYGMDWKNWKEKAMWHRDTEKENELIKKLEVDVSSNYNFINKYFRSDNTGVAAVNVNNGYRNIEMEILPDFSLFDWAPIIENATEIHTVSTSIIYILELLKLKAQKVDIYCRKPDERNLNNVEYILTSHNYVQHL